MEIKTFSAQVKKVGEADGLEPGQFEAIVSVFGNVDSYGDVVVKGAFKDTLADWKSSGDPIPVYYSHRMDDPDFNIGYVIDAKETDVGLWVKAQIDQGEDATRVAKSTEKLMKGRRLTQFSFAYDVMEGGWVDKKADDGDGNAQDVSYYELRKLKLFEVGPTPIGANQETELLGVKRVAEVMTQRVKAGAVLSSKNKDSLIAARDAINEVLKSAESDGSGSETDKSKAAQPSEPANAEESRGTKAEEPTLYDPARDARLSILSLYETD